MDGAERFECLRGLREGVCVHVPKRNAGARFEQAAGNGESNAARAAGDDGMAVGEVDFVHSLERWVIKRGAGDGEECARSGFE